MKETKFKQTEVGMIPSDWEVTTIGDFCKVYDGTHQTPNYVDFGIPFYSVENVSADDFEHTKYISLKEYTQISKRANIVKGDILMTRIGSIGVCKYVDWNCKAGFYVSLALLKCNDSVDARFICHLSNSENFKREIELHSLLTAIPQKINLGPISNVRIALPKKLEQQRIANALSDVDTLIANLEKFIAKKKNIKQGAMQQLLTGKKRLPGFGSDERTGSRPTDERRKECLSERSAKREAEKSSGYKMTELGLIPNDWEVKTISQVGKIIGGGTPSTFNSAYWNGSVQWFTPAELSKAGKYVSKSERTITKLGVENCAAKILPAGTILLTTRASIGTSAILKAPACTNQGFQSLVVNSENSNEFLYYLLSTKVDEMMSLASGSTFLEISPKKLGGIQLQIPSSRAEQTAIANVLSDMDTEISALETKLAKYRKLKTGMMQQLLTGKIRLIKAETIQK